MKGYPFVQFVSIKNMIEPSCLKFAHSVSAYIKTLRTILLAIYLKSSLEKFYAKYVSRNSQILL